MLNFSLGQVALIPAGANPTPVPVALLTDLSIDISYKEVEFRGNQQFPIEIALGEATIKGKAKNGNINGATLSALLQGSTTAAGLVAGVIGELQTIPGTPWQLTVANGATYADDLGVLDLTANKWLTRVASAPATGQYSVNTATGLYTFAAADTAHNLSINYSYAIAGSGKTTTLNNQLMGTTTNFALAAFDSNTIGGLTRYFGWKFPAVVVPKLAHALKPNAYTDQDIEFSVRQDTVSAQILKYYTQE